MKVPSDRPDNSNTYGTPPGTRQNEDDLGLSDSPAITTVPQGKPFDLVDAGRSTPPSGHPNKYGAIRWSPKIT